ncbi:hypothetical protein BC833DRAFT_579930 [Globomyces pollinis-pini]|nr:hypothetical protein BC833DRAFT_579930 [Globomyces pollinis-pini]
MVATFEQQQYINKDLLNTTCDKWKHRKCSGCGTASTPLWRRNLLGEIVCNACGNYCL